MDIRHLNYFIALVEQEYNMTETAKSLYISQPTLSIMINNFEKNENVSLFERTRGRIVGLTQEGENYYYDARGVIKKYNDMLNNLRDTSDNVKGTITIGIPPLVLSVVFSEILPNMILANPDIKFIIKETGAYQLREELLLGNVDIAILLSPEMISQNLIESYPVITSELTAFMSPEHELANRKSLRWSEINQQKLAIFNETFLIHHYLKEHFVKQGITPKIVLQSQSWDFLLNSTKINHELLSILPKSIGELYGAKGIISLPFTQPLPWIVTICRLKKPRYSNIEAYILEKMLEEFNKK